MKEKRDLKIGFTTGGSGSVTTRIGLPVTWVKKLGITPDDRNVEVTLEDDKIIIKKK